MVRTTADTATSTTNRFVFYTTLADYTTNAAAYAPIKINTPLTADRSGNIYFGYEVTGSVPANVANLGTGGIVKINGTTGKAIFASVQSMGIDGSLSRSAMNAAPALSASEGSVYVALTGGNLLPCAAIHQYAGDDLQCAFDRPIEWRKRGADRLSLRPADGRSGTGMCSWA